MDKKSKKYRSKTQGIYSELEYQEQRNKLFAIRLKRMWPVIVLMTIVYSIIIFAYVFGIKSTTLSNILFFPLTTNRDVEKQVEILNTKIDKIQENIKSTKSNSDSNSIAFRIALLEEDQKNLKETISYDLDKALTAKLLREKQIQTENRIAQIEKNQESLSGRMDSIIIVPLVGFVLSVVSAFIYFLFTRDKKRKSETTE